MVSGASKMLLSGESQSGKEMVCPCGSPFPLELCMSSSASFVEAYGFLFSQVAAPTRSQAQPQFPVLFN